MKRHLFLFPAAAALGLLAASVQAKVLDNFDDNIKTNWTDFTFIPGVGSPVEANGQFKFNLPPGRTIFAASTKSSETFTLQEGRTIEFSVDLVTGNGKDSFAVLSFIPKSAAVSELAGYSLAKSTTDFLLTKGIGKYFFNQNPEPSIKNDNVTLVLTLTVKGGSVFINGKVLDKDADNAVIFEQSAVDTPEADFLEDGTDSPQAPYAGEGNFVLLCYEDYDMNQPQATYEVIFDNAETYVCDEVLVDNFDDNLKTQWTDFTFMPGLGAPVESGGQFKFNLPPGQTIFAASTRTSPAFELTEGNRLQFKVDLVSTNGDDAFAVMGFVPAAAQINQLSGYTIAKSASDILITKGINKYFYNDDPDIPIKNENVTMVLTLTMKDGSVIINGKVLDKDNGNAVIFDHTAVDTPAADLLVDGTDSPEAPYAGIGNFVLFCYEDYDMNRPQASYEVTFDNAIACRAPLAGNVAPVITEIQPEAYRNFLPASTLVSFKASDDKPLPDAGLSITLNGMVFTTANGLVLSALANERVVSVGGLESNVNYTAVLRAVDVDGAARSETIPFDTFATTSFVIEVEDFNFGAGSFWDDPMLIPEGTGPAGRSYAGQSGSNDIDYFDTRTEFRDVPYRPLDPVRMLHSLDFPRNKFADAGGIAAGVYDYDVSDFQPDEWLNFTRTFSAGSYNVYLRQSVSNVPSYDSVLEMVTGNRGEPGQTTAPLGTFPGSLTGFRHGNTPLTEPAGGSRISLQLDGVKTLRLRQAGLVPDDAAVLQNYLIFIRQADSAPFLITAITWNTALRQVTFSWPSEPNRTYKVEAAPDPAQPWTVLAPNYPSQGAATSYTDTPPAALTRRFYRVWR